jgi:hypothetical protein
VEYDSHIKSAKAVQGLKLWGKRMEEAVAGSSVYVVNSKEDEKIIYSILKAELDTLRYGGRRGEEGRGGERREEDGGGWRRMEEDGGGMFLLTLSS